MRERIGYEGLGGGKADEARNSQLEGSRTKAAAFYDWGCRTAGVELSYDLVRRFGAGRRCAGGKGN